MKPISDYHLHTYLCGHATGEPEDYIKQAIKIGLTDLGFSDHAPLVSHVDPSITMSFDELPLYLKMIESLKDKYKNKINIKIGIEADFIDGYQTKTKEILSGYPYDYVIGSVHYIKHWAFDNPHELKEWKNHDVDDVYRKYYENLRLCAESGLFDIMAHVDLVKKFGHKPSSNIDSEVKKTAKVFKKNGMVIEINTSGLRKPVKEIYPSLEVLKIYCREGVPVTFGSDSHSPDEVGKDFDKALELAKKAGYKQYVLFKKRNIEKTLDL